MATFGRSAMLAGLMAVAAGCGSIAPPPSPSPTAEAIAFTPIPVVPASLEPGSFRLPTNGATGGGGCLGLGLDHAVLHGNPADPHVAWIVTSAGREEVFFPLGFTARFTPRLEVVNAADRVVAHEDDSVDGGCWTVNDGPVLILSDPEFVGIK
jgi:hypothetical protein